MESILFYGINILGDFKSWQTVSRNLNTVVKTIPIATIS